jgi:hypothetical protein
MYQTFAISTTQQYILLQSRHPSTKSTIIKVNRNKIIHGNIQYQSVYERPFTNSTVIRKTLRNYTREGNKTSRLVNCHAAFLDNC